MSADRPDGRTPAARAAEPKGGVRRLLEDLRTAKVLVIHPRDEEGETLIKQLRRIGCDVRAAWPVPAELPSGIDTVFILIEHAGPEDVPWRGEVDGPTIVAVVEYESPTTLKALVDWNAHGVVNKPARSVGILSSLVLARYLHGYEARLAAKVRKLEETLKARREIERATQILMKLKGVSDHDAYQMLRDQATSRRLPLAQVAASIVSASETLGSFGLDVRAK